MTKLNYQKAARHTHMSKQPIVNSSSTSVVVNPTLRRKVMRFGKYKNWEYRDLPDDYLKWAILNLEEENLLNDLIKELQRRDSSFIIESKVKGQ